jgi:hypothetical protein
MDAMSIINLVVFGFCSFASGWNVGTKHYNWAIVDGFLAVLNFAVAWL